MRVEKLLCKMLYFSFKNLEAKDLPIGSDVSTHSINYLKQREKERTSVPLSSLWQIFLVAARNHWSRLSLDPLDRASSNISPELPTVHREDEQGGEMRKGEKLSSWARLSRFLIETAFSHSRISDCIAQRPAFNQACIVCTETGPGCNNVSSNWRTDIHCVLCTLLSNIKAYLQIQNAFKKAIEGWSDVRWELLSDNPGRFSRKFKLSVRTQPNCWSQMKEQKVPSQKFICCSHSLWL